MVSKLLLCCLLGVLTALPAKDHDDQDSNFQDPILKIVGGSVAEHGQFPWQLHLKRNENFTCGAVLISSDRALTAAHCLDDGQYSATAGQHDISTQSGREVTLNVSSWNRHPWYNTGPGYPNDIAILRFSTPFPSNDYIKPIIMANESSPDYAGEDCTISGWGMLSDGRFPTRLRYAVMPAITNSECGQKWLDITGATINDGHICLLEPKKDACSLDSGGPMVCRNTLAGITSWGDPSCRGDYPGVYSRVSYFREWINAFM